jgi:hypothetical protein
MIGAAALRIMSRIGAEAFEHSAALSTTAVDPEWAIRWPVADLTR